MTKHNFSDRTKETLP